MVRHGATAGNQINISPLSLFLQAQLFNKFTMAANLVFNVGRFLVLQEGNSFGEANFSMVNPSSVAKGHGKNEPNSSGGNHREGSKSDWW